ncbi:MAG TPA: NIPSNAP family containing protein [Candidatus Limnocylindria bacterium]|nr:NIPSNAP family containing protein [Candidatus Limnocylindria bacterium]
MASQLRDYTIEQGRFGVFLAAWRAGVLPLRRRHGFTVHAWAIEEESRFVWVVSIDGSRDEFEARETAYYASPERKAIDPDPRQWVVAERLVFVEPAASP